MTILKFEVEYDSDPNKPKDQSRWTIRDLDSEVHIDHSGSSYLRIWKDQCLGSIHEPNHKSLKISFFEEK